MRTMLSFDIAGLQYRWDDVMEHLATLNDDYDLSKKELIDDDRIGEPVYRYRFDAMHIELVQEPEDSKYAGAVRILADGILIGYIPHSRAEEARQLIANDDTHGFMLNIEGGKYHEVREDEDNDDFEKESYTMITDEAFPEGYIYKYVDDGVEDPDAKKQYPAFLYTFIFILGIVLIILSALLCIAVPVAGIVGVLAGIAAIVYSKKKKPKK